MLRKCIVTAVILSATSFAQTAPTSAVTASRLAHLRHGINLSEWFAQVYDPRGYTKEHFETWTTSADIALIKSAGFDHVRLSVNPQPMMDAAHRQHGSEDYFGYLDAAMKMILDAGLSVQLDMHPDSDFKTRLAKEDDFVERFADFWRGVAQHYASWDTDRILFEILNEPETRDPYRWYGVESKLAAAIRQGAPANTIIATGAKWDDDHDMLLLEPLRDPNVIYVFHFYDPHIFTHQGAT
jgi:endoglucanase